MRLQNSIPFDPGTEENFETFPALPAVFALFPEEQPGVVPQPYLSHTRDLRRRLRRLLAAALLPSRRLNLRSVVRRIDFQPVGSNFEAQWLIFLLNQFHYPRQFRRRLRLKPPVLVKVNLANRFPRCYPTRRLSRDGSLYYGPFPSRSAAERFTGKFLDLFKIRRCLPDLNPDPSHPGCIYSQMRMCLAPCFKGCTDEEYQQEVGRVVDFLNSRGSSLARELEMERAEASENLEFERAARAHHRLEKAQEVLVLRPPLVREISSLHAILVLPGAQEKTAVFFRVVAGELWGPGTLSLEENVSSPQPLDQRIQELLRSLGKPVPSPSNALPGTASTKAQLPHWEHLSLLARWYYSSFRTGEMLMLDPGAEAPYARLVRLCRKVMARENGM